MDSKAAAELLKESSWLLDRPIFGSESCLHFMAIESNCDAVRWLLERGAKVDGVAEDETPLIVAAQLGHVEVCKLLLDYDADVHAVDCIEESALQKASQTGKLEVMELLLKAGANPNYREMCGETALEMALPRKREEIEELLERYS